MIRASLCIMEEEEEKEAEGKSMGGKTRVGLRRDGSILFSFIFLSTSRVIFFE